MATQANACGSSVVRELCGSARASANAVCLRVNHEMQIRRPRSRARGHDRRRKPRRPWRAVPPAVARVCVCVCVCVCFVVMCVCAVLCSICACADDRHSDAARLRLCSPNMQAHVDAGTCKRLHHARTHAHARMHAHARTHAHAHAHTHARASPRLRIAWPSSHARAS